MHKSSKCFMRLIKTFDSVSCKQDLFQNHNKNAQFLYKCCRSITCPNMSAPYEDHEVYDGHRADIFARDGPVLLPANQADYLIIGGGVMGQALAYNLWRYLEGTTVVKASKYRACTLAIVEKEPALIESSTALSVGGIRQQFSNSANIRLSLESAEFLRNIKSHLSTVRNPDPDVQFNCQGYLTMATKAGAEQLIKNYNTQVDAGAKIMLFSGEGLKETFPWLNVDEIELATYGVENEGWFDPMSLVNALKHKNSSFGVANITGEVVGFKKEILKDREDIRNVVTETYDGNRVTIEEQLDGVYIKTAEHEKPVYIKCANIFNCAGPLSGKMAELAGVGNAVDEDVHPLLKHKLPIERRKRYVYVVHCPDAPLLDCPMVIDPSGFYVRREGMGGKYVCGMSPLENQEPSTDNLEVDYEFFNEEVWPRLAHRIPAFENLKLTSAWAGYYDYNTFDQNAIIGPHPYYFNLNFLSGFSGHGIQQAYAASKGLADLMINGIDNETKRNELEPFSFNRIINNKPLVEYNII